MNISITKLQTHHLAQACEIWNEIVEQGEAFPQIETLTMETGKTFFAEQTLTAVAIDSDTNNVLGLYILHPNNIGRCGHICNASYAVKSGLRGFGIGEKLVSHCVASAPEYGFKILQFNAVVETNAPALKLYNKLGFTQLGIIPNGFLKKDGTYENIIPHFIQL